MDENSAIIGKIEPKQFEFKKLGYRLVLEVSADGVSCSCKYEPTSGGAPMTHDEFTGFLKQAKVVEGLDEEAIYHLLTSANANEKVADLVVACGTAMVPGADGSIVLALPAEDDSGAKDEEEITVDFHNVQKILNVTSGQLIATVQAPGEGTAGRSVRGTEIPPQAGAVLNLALGQNVRLGDDGTSIFAVADGRVYCNGPEISVEEIYTIKGDVDFKVGNITFNGFVDISGDVLDGFSVNAAKGIKVQGNIGVSTIESQGDIIFCGMNGQGKGRIRCNGNITANFIDDVHVECRGNVVVESEIRNSFIKSLATVKVNKGVISGGECIALGGVEASTIGSASSLHTHIVVGVNYLDMAEFNTLFNKMKLLIADFNANKSTADPKVFMAERAAVADQLQQIRSREYEDANQKVNVKKFLHEGVTITLGEHSEEIREERKGPCSIIENTIEGGFRYLGMTDLGVKAKDIERAFVQQHEMATRKIREDVQ